MRPAFLGILFSLLTSCFFAEPAQVILIRHGEKDGGHYLSALGLERANALAAFFQNNHKMLTFGPPVAIFAAQPNPKAPSHREIQTVMPLAQQLSLQVQSPYDSTDVKDLAQLILSHENYNGKMVLVCWEHGIMDDLAAAFGVQPKPPKYPGDRFDLIYMITYGKNSHPDFCIELQELMFSDSPNSPADFPVCKKE